jgi:hypothetical protein
MEIYRINNKSWQVIDTWGFLCFPDMDAFSPPPHNTFSLAAGY